VTDTDPRAAVAPHPPSRVLFADRRGARCGGGTPLGLWHRYWRQDLRDPEVRSQVTSTAWRSLGGDRTAKGLEALAAFALIPPAAPGKRTPGPSDSNVPDQGQRLLRPAQRHRGSGQEWGPGPQSRVSCPLTRFSALFRGWPHHCGASGSGRRLSREWSDIHPTSLWGTRAPTLLTAQPQESAGKEVKAAEMDARWPLREVDIVTSCQGSLEGRGALGTTGEQMPHSQGGPSSGPP
jgi:hypothetical protein